MGTIAARDCIRILELTEQVTAATLAAGVQALELRLQSGELSDKLIGPVLGKLKADVRSGFAFVAEDRRLDKDLRALIQRIQNREFQWGAV